MKPIAEQVIEGKRYQLTPQPKQSQCAGCDGWKGITPSGKNLCTELGELCVDHPKHGWVEDVDYVAPAAEPVAQGAVEEFDW